MPLTHTEHSEPFYSFHAFLFPFEWQYSDAPRRATLEEKTSLQSIQDIMHRAGGHWERRATWTKPTSTVQYNEANYFYDFVRPVLYDTRSEDNLQAHYYNKLIHKDAIYVIQLVDGRTYQLDIDDVVVSFYATGVGVMAFHLYNRLAQQAHPDDILRINQFGRRLYPPFLKTPLDKLGEQAFFEFDDWAQGLDGPQGVGEMPLSLDIQVSGRSVYKEDYREWKKQPILEREPGLIRQVLPSTLLGKMTLTPVLDDRMFVLCWLGNDHLAKQLKGNYNTSHWWYKYIFVDAGKEPSCKNEDLLRQQLKDHTYTRWTDNKIFFGMSRYSFVVLSETFHTSFFSRVLCSHVQTIYYKIVMLCLVQRACLMRFSAEVTWISQMPKNERLLGRKVSSLYKQYLRFVNKIYFREVTAQEQGIELYDHIQDRMRLDAHVKDLEGEIEELHNYVSMLEEENRNDKLDLLTYIGAFFVVPSFIATYLALFGEIDVKDHGLELAAISLLSSIIAYLIIRFRGGWRYLFIVVLLVILVLITFFPQFLIQ